MKKLDKLISKYKHSRERYLRLYAADRWDGEVGGADVGGADG